MFALNLARNAAVEFNEPVGFFSLEMTSMELMDRLIATKSGISSDKLKGKLKLLPDEWQILEQSAGGDGDFQYPQDYCQGTEHSYHSTCAAEQKPDEPNGK